MDNVPRVRDLGKLNLNETTLSNLSLQEKMSEENSKSQRKL